MTHTPGPWLITENPPYVVDTEGYNVARTDTNNLRLIAAAPELLEALKEAEVLCDEACQGQSLENECWSILWRIQAAIAKAEGK